MELRLYNGEETYLDRILKERMLMQFEVIRAADKRDSYSEMTDCILFLHVLLDLYVPLRLEMLQEAAATGKKALPTAVAATTA